VPAHVHGGRLAVVRGPYRSSSPRSLPGRPAAVGSTDRVILDLAIGHARGRAGGRSAGPRPRSRPKTPRGAASERTRCSAGDYLAGNIPADYGPTVRPTDAGTRIPPPSEQGRSWPRPAGQSSRGLVPWAQPAARPSVKTLPPNTGKPAVRGGVVT